MKMTALVLVGLLASLQAAAMTKSGVTFKDQFKYNKKNLVLNGLGVREATIFNVDVYVAGIYLVKKTKSPDEILGSNSPKVFRMEFVREVSADQINDAWQDSLGGKGFEAELARLKKATKDLKTGDQLTFTFNPRGATYYFNRKKAARFSNPKFAKALLGIWFGPNPPNSGLKTGLLGL